MLKLTDGAASMISQLVQDRQLPPGAGLRISQREDHEALEMSLASGAEPDDVVVVDPRARVFLAPVATVRLDGATLDVRDDDVASAFFVRP